MAAWLADPSAARSLSAGRAALEAAPDNPMAAAAGLRRALPELPADRASAVLEQAELRLLAHQRYGLDTSRLLLTRDGLEQATRPEVAAHRARLIREAGAQRVIDLTGGLGFDSAALVNAGLDVTAVERDPVVAIFLAHNCPQVRVVAADAMDPDLLHSLLSGLHPSDVVFVDPARRDTSGARAATLRSHPERDPARWSPPWPQIEALTHPRIAAKVAPSFRAPRGWHAEWVSVQRTVVECAVYSWPVFAAPRRATMFANGLATVLDVDDTATPAPISRIGAWLHEPDPAIVSADAVSALIREDPVLRPVDHSSTWLTSDTEPRSGMVRSFAVVAELEGSTTSQRRQLDRIGVESLTVKSRDVDVAPGTVLRALDRREGIGHVIVLTRRKGRTVRILCAQARPRSS